MLELYHVKIDGLLADCSLTVADGEMVGVYGATGTGKTTLLRVVLGLLPKDGGHISIDGELLTPLSAPYFRRAAAYVPQHLSLVEGFDTTFLTGEDLRPWSCMTVDEQFLALVRHATGQGKKLLVVDEPPSPVSESTRREADRLLMEAARHGASVLAVSPLIAQKKIQL